MLLSIIAHKEESVTPETNVATLGFLPRKKEKYRGSAMKLKDGDKAEDAKASGDKKSSRKTWKRRQEVLIAPISPVQ